MLLVLIGSDLSMMEALNSYGCPFHQRGREMVLGPLNPAEVGRMLGLDPTEAFDAALVTGGLPLICAEWSRLSGARCRLWPRRSADRLAAVSGGLQASRGGW